MIASEGEAEVKAELGDGDLRFWRREERRSWLIRGRAVIAEGSEGLPLGGG